MPNDLIPASLIYHGTPIQQRHEMLSLTDMWRAAGGPDGRGPADWRVLPETQRFAEFLAETFNAGKSGNELFHAVRGGKSPGTWAHWQIGLAYAKYLSPEFHMWCNTVVRERMEGRVVSAGVTVAELDAHVRAAVGGIVKAVVARALDERLEPIELAVVTLADKIKAICAPSGRYKTSTEYVPALSVVDGASVPQKGRGGLVRRASNALDRFCRREGVPVRSEAHTERRLFHVDAVARWIDAEGREVIRRHLDRMTGQTVMRFPARPGRSPDGAA